MNYVSDLASCLTSLNSDKQTERKQGAAKWSTLSRNREVLQLLDENSQGKKRKDLTWDVVLLTVLRYIELEIESIKSAKVLAETKERRKREAGAMLSSVVQTAEKRRSQMKVHGIYKHVLEVLQDETMVAALFQEYTSLLCKSIFVHDSFMAELTPSLWHDLLQLYIDKFESERSMGCKSIAVQAVCCLAGHINKLPILKPRLLFKFFHYTFKNVRQEASSPTLEIQLRALNKFSQAVAIDCRHQLCTLGEKLIPLLISAWNKCWIAAKRCLESIYQLLSDDFSRLDAKIQRSKSTLMQKADTVELAADVIHQVIYFESYCCPPTSDQPDSSRKKSKVESFWMRLQDYFLPSVDAPTIIAWLQVVGVMFEAYPGDFTKDDFAVVLQSMLNLQCSLKNKNEVLSVVFSTLTAMAKRSQHYELKDEAVATTWKSIISSSIKFSIVPQCQKNVFQLFCQVAQGHLIDEAGDFLKLLLASHSQTNLDSVQLLLTILESLPLPVHLPGSDQIQSSIDCSFSLRKRLVSWLLPCPEAENSSQLEKSMSLFVFPETAMCIVSLLDKIPSHIVKCYPCSSSMLGKTDKGHRWLQEIQSSYVDSAKNRFEKKEDDKICGNQRRGIIGGFLNEIVQYAIEQLQSILNLINGDDEGFSSSIPTEVTYKLEIELICLLCNILLALPAEDAFRTQACLDIQITLMELLAKATLSFSSSLHMLNLLDDQFTAQTVKCLDTLMKSFNVGFLKRVTNYSITRLISHHRESSKA